jgi:hypothetical protein
LLSPQRTAFPSADQESPSEDEEAAAAAPFVDVGLNDEAKPKKRSIFARFTAADSTAAAADSAAPASAAPAHHGFLFTGRKRGQSGQGAELHPLPSPATAPRVSEVAVSN